jgi:preprotein translocase subunit YajC
MTVAEVFAKFDFPTAMVIVLLATVGTLFFILWRSSEKQKEELRADLKEARSKADQINTSLIASIKEQNINTMTIANVLAPLKTSTDMIPSVVTDQKRALDDIGHILDMIRNQDTQPRTRRGD